jgi:putative iron-dependent peroxidase
VLDDALDLFLYAGGRDLTGYEDGTENPKDAAAAEAALVASAAGAGLAGSSFVAAQRWTHDLHTFRAHPASERDAIIGRRRDTNDEIADAPLSAHVKRAAQESFEPAAFMLRRSMPWATADAQGLEFIAFGESLDRFERVLRRMVGLDDGVTDALFSFSRPTRGGYYWCPPVARGRLDLSRLGL